MSSTGTPPWYSSDPSGDTPANGSEMTAGNVPLHFHIAEDGTVRAYLLATCANSNAVEITPT